MASLAVTFPSLQAGATIIASNHNTNNSDIVNYINNRNSGSIKWDGISTSGMLSVDGNITFGSLGLLSDGLVGAPSLTFTADSDTGFYRIGANNFAASCQGARVLNLSPTDITIYATQCLLPDGLVGTPGLAFSSNTNTGIYRIGSNNLGISANGTKALDIKATGVDILGTTTNNSANAGFIGEVISSSIVSYTNMATSGQYGNITSISLTAGDWDIIGQAAFSANGATISTQIFTAISINSGNTTTDHVDGTNVTFQQPTGSGNVAYRLSLSATTTVYLKAKTTYTVAIPQAVGIIYGRRTR